MKNILKKLGIIRGTKIHSFLVLFKPIYGFIKPPVRSYSQKGEDPLILSSIKESEVSKLT